MDSLDGQENCWSSILKVFKVLSKPNREGITMAKVLIWWFQPVHNSKRMNILLSLDLHTVNNEVANYFRPHHSRVNNAIVVTPWCNYSSIWAKPGTGLLLNHTSHHQLLKTSTSHKVQTDSVRPLFVSDIRWGVLQAIYSILIGQDLPACRSS